MMRKVFEVLSAIALGTALVIAGVTPAAAQSRQRISFAKGNDNAAVKGSITGHEYRDYVLRARKGQNLSVSLITDGSAYFNILPPGSTGEAIYNGSTSGADTTVKLPKDGDYTIRVYLMGAAKSGKKSVPYTVSVTIM
jgi:hypothetical protein